jgi:hypothetical protein
MEIDRFDRRRTIVDAFCDHFRVAVYGVIKNSNFCHNDVHSMPRFTMRLSMQSVVNPSTQTKEVPVVLCLRDFAAEDITIKLANVFSLFSWRYNRRMISKFDYHIVLPFGFYLVSPG